MDVDLCNKNKNKSLWLLQNTRENFSSKSSKKKGKKRKIVASCSQAV